MRFEALFVRWRKHSIQAIECKSRLTASGGTMSTLFLLRLRTAHRPRALPAATAQRPRSVLDRWLLAWAQKAEARLAQPGYPHSRYY